MSNVCQLPNCLVKSAFQIQDDPFLRRDHVYANVPHSFIQTRPQQCPRKLRYVHKVESVRVEPHSGRAVSLVCGIAAVVVEVMVPLLLDD